MGGELEECGDGKVTYVGGLRKCILVNEGTEAEEVQRMVIKITSSDLSSRNYSII